MTVVDDLKAVRELLSEPERWTQGAMARDAEGNSVEMGDGGEPCCWCLAGAVKGVCSGDARPVFAALRKVRGGALVTWNDAPDRTHAEVLALLDAAIEAESAKEGAAK